MAQDFMSGLPPELLAEQQSLRRRQAVAEMMLAQGQKSPQGQKVGRFYVAPSPVQGIAQLANAYLGGEGLRDVEKGMADLTTKYNEGLAAAVKNYTTPQTVTPTTPNDDEGNPMPAAPAQNPRDRIMAAMMSPYAPVREMAKLDFATSERNADRQADREFRSQESELARQGRLQERLLTLEAADRNAVLSREERARRDKEAADLRRELQASQQAHAAMLAREGRADRALIAANKDDAKKSALDEGRGTVSGLVTQLRDYYAQLSDNGGITDPNKGTLDNINSWISSTGAGQAAGRAMGTKNQTLRDSISQQRPLLLNAIKSATGMSAKQMDSNAELKLYLSAATDPTLSIKANMDALDNLDRLYGLGDKPNAGPAAAPSAPRPGAPKVGDVVQGFRYKGGDPSKQSSWEATK